MTTSALPTRRAFLRRAVALSTAGLATRLDLIGLAAAASAPAAPDSDYKALVCVFMFGGNDSSNMVMPVTNYAQYLTARPVSSGINIPKGDLANPVPGMALPITPHPRAGHRGNAECDRHTPPCRLRG